MEVTIQKLRRWFATEMSYPGADAKYTNPSVGSTPSDVLERYYLDYSLDRLKETYYEAGITVLD